MAGPALPAENLLSVWPGLLAGRSGPPGHGGHAPGVPRECPFRRTVKGDCGQVCNFLPDTQRYGILSLCLVRGLKLQNEDIFTERAKSDHISHREHTFLHAIHPLDAECAETQPKPQYRVGPQPAGAGE